MLLLPPGGLSSRRPNQCHSLPIPIRQGTGALQQQPSSCPNSSQLSRQFSWCAIRGLLELAGEHLKKDRPFWVKSCLRASLTCSWLLVRSYRRTTKRSKVSRLSSTIEGVGVAPKAQKVAVTSSHTFHVSHAVFLLLPPKLDTVSHPLKAWNTGNSRHSRDDPMPVPSRELLRT